MSSREQSIASVEMAGKGPIMSMNLTGERGICAEDVAEKVRTYIGSPEGAGKSPCTAPSPRTLRRRVLTRMGTLEEREVILERYLGCGLGSIVFKGWCDGKAIVEKLATGLSDGGLRHTIGKKMMEMVFLFFRQAAPSYRTNFYAAMANHYASRIVEDASEFEYGEPIIPRIQYTAYDAECGGYVVAYEYVEGRHIRPGDEEALLKERLREWKDFIAGRLGLWGLARQCDEKNINSPGNVLLVDEERKKFRLIDITPGVLGGQIYLLPLEYEYFFKGLITGNFLPFGDAVDMRQLREYERQVSMRADELGARFGPERVSAFIENCKAFEFYNAKWRTSEPQLLASPSRIFLYLFDVETAKATTRTLATLLEYKGIISPAEAASTRQNLQFSNGLLAVGALRTKLLMRLLVYLLLSLPGRIWNAMKFLFKTLWCSAVVVKRFLRFVVKVYTDSEYRKQCALEKINSWLADFEHSDRWISSDDARVIRHEAENSSILDILQLAPLWAVVKIFKPPFIGTCANLAIIYMLFHTLNPGWLIPLFADGVIRFAIAVAVTRFRYKLLLLLSLLPTLGFAIPIPTQIMKDTPHLAEFLVRDVFGAKMGMMFPGIDRNSFRVYFYIRMMKIPVVIMRLLVRACGLLPVAGRWSAQPKADKI